MSSVINYLIFLIIIKESYSQLQKNLVHIQAKDPDMHRKDVTFGGFTFLRGQLFDEQHLNNKGVCTGRCSDYENTHYHYNDRYNKSITQQLFKCSGRIVKCRNVNNFDISVVVYADNNMYRYKVNKERNDYQIRKAENYHDHYNSQKHHDLYTNYDVKSDYNNCATCKCYCDDTTNKKIIRSFCLDAVKSRTEDGYVITGLRFRIRARIVHLEIQQGKLVNGVVDRNTVHWFAKNWCSLTGAMNYDNRSFQLDDIILPHNQVLTGLMINRYDPKTKIHGYRLGRFSLGVIATVLDNKGNLDVNNWFTYHRIQGFRDELSTPNRHYIKFHPSDWKYDFAQHIIPFLDLQDVVTEPPSPVSGAGIYYKSKKGYGGFIAPKIVVRTNHRYN
ncbi:uncharacterized protein LOC103575366 isoform X2 [Microplitis demolitor]|uniref:uncharacterized protein LOC103575366 isoform X2 n=1 Tax=Microplitis demolitor TaxID=69319 RepID=UPI00235B6909|nr:uncharacterized protein LOC103575366 isoform X2 [Microplitis demolitor]